MYRHIKHDGLVILVMVLFMVGLFYWQSKLEVVPRMGVYVPYEIEGWQGMDTQLSAFELQTLDPDIYLIRNYINGDQQFNLLVLQYIKQGLKKELHPPKACLLTGGWEITKESTIKVAGHRYSDVMVTMKQLVLQKNKEKLTAYYWFYSGGQTAANQLKHKYNVFKTLLVDNTIDCGLVRIMVKGAGTSAELSIISYVVDSMVERNGL